jgi:hypothetical protein
LGRCAIDGAYRLATALECAEERTEAQQRQVDRLPRHADVAPADVVLDRAVKVEHD